MAVTVPKKETLTSERLLFGTKLAFLGVDFSLQLYSYTTSAILLVRRQKGQTGPISRCPQAPLASRRLLAHVPILPHRPTRLTVALSASTATFGSLSSGSTIQPLDSTLTLLISIL